MQKNKPMSQSLFRTAVLEVVKAIPRGKTKSYQEVATIAGYPKAFRAVASVMSHNYDPTVPCHRVIHSNGQIGNYNRGGEKAKYVKLRGEGWQSTTTTG